MFKFYINTDSRTLSSVEIYADAEKRTRLNSPLDAVERFAHEVRIGFLGAHAPGAADKVTLVVAWDGVTDSVLEAQTSANRFYIEAVGTRVEDAEAAGEPPTWSFDVKLASAALEAAFSSRTRLTLRAAAVVENEAAGTHVEHQFTIAGNASIYAGGISDPSGGIIQYLKVVRISWEDYQALESLESGVHYDVVGAPSEVDEHDKDPAAHPELLRRIAAAKGDLMERLGVAGVMSEGAFLGVDADGMLRVPKASADTPGAVQLSLTATQIDDPLGIGKQANGRIVGDMAQVRAVVNTAVAGVEAALDESVSELKEADAAASARIDSNTSSIEALNTEIAARYTKAEIDGVDTGAEIMKRLAEDENNLKGIDLPPEFWTKYFESVKEWQEDPTATKNWNRTSIDENNNPTADDSYKDILVDFNVTSAYGYQNAHLKYESFARKNWKVIYMPNCTSFKNAFNFSGMDVDLKMILKKNTEVSHAISETKSIKIETSGAQSLTTLFGINNKKVHLVSKDVLNINELFTNVYWTIGNALCTDLTIDAPQVVNANWVCSDYMNLSRFVLIGGLPNAINIKGFCKAIESWNLKNLKEITFIDSEASFPSAVNGDSAFVHRKGFNQFIAFPSLSSGANMFKNTALDAANIAAILNSLPAWADGATHVITFTRSPGIASTASEETFGGVENCPTFDNDDEVQTLRTAYASAIMRGWTVEI